MGTRRAGGVMVHPSSQWSKRQRGVGGQRQPISLLEFFRGNGQPPIMGCMQLLEGQRVTKRGSGRETMTVALLSHSILICLQHELTFYI